MNTKPIIMAVGLCAAVFCSCQKEKAITMKQDELTSEQLMEKRYQQLDGVFNFRDMGSIRTTDGKTVKWGKVFRSDELSNLSDADRKKLESYPIRTVVDFRSKAEADKAPDRLPTTVTDYLLMDVAPGDMSGATDLSDLSALKGVDLSTMMTGLNVQLVTDDEYIATYRRFFALLQDESKIPLLFHCTAGKDRTGLAAALFLFSLGVDEATIMQDYLASNDYIKPKFAAILEQHPELEPLMGVDASYLQAGIDAMKRHYGSVENYLTEQLQVDLSQMHSMYLD